ncbi:MAG TPA: 23S rRNA (guanosine(2251)-2'-O)-methyltransferase RlmB [Anaerolineales bacterium]|nr:23S rRNA (guanosine(2251)-2'-O)-methyltransferase RlmB [Anaerolineales bacterium]
MKEYIYSRNAVYETLRAGRRQAFQLLVAEGVREKGKIAEIIALARGRKFPTRRVPRDRLNSIHRQNQGVALQVSGYPYRPLDDILARAAEREQPPFVLILDTLQDPQNLGTLLRTAEAVGVHGVVIPLARTAQVTPAVVNASSGASEHLLIAQANLSQAIGKLKEAGLWIVGLEGSAEAGSPAQIRLDGPLGLVVGSEGQGMRQLVRKSCDFLLQLPMRGKIESLNAAVAGSVALYLAWQARGEW